MMLMILKGLGSNGANGNHNKSNNWEVVHCGLYEGKRGLANAPFRGAAEIR